MDDVTEELILIAALGIAAYAAFRYMQSLSVAQIGSDIGSGIVDGVGGVVSGAAQTVSNGFIDGLISLVGWKDSATATLDPTGVAATGGGVSGGGAGNGGGGGW